MVWFLCQLGQLWHLHWTACCTNICFSNMHFLVHLGGWSLMMCNATTLWQCRNNLSVCLVTQCCVSLHVSVTTCVCHYMCLSLHVSVTTCVCHYMCLSLHVSVTTCVCYHCIHVYLTTEVTDVKAGLSVE